MAPWVSVDIWRAELSYSDINWEKDDFYFNQTSFLVVEKKIAEEDMTAGEDGKKHILCYE